MRTAQIGPDLRLGAGSIPWLRPERLRKRLRFLGPDYMVPCWPAYVLRGSSRVPTPLGQEEERLRTFAWEARVGSVLVPP